MAVSLLVQFRPMGSYSDRRVESLVALQSDRGFAKLLQLDFNAAAYLASDARSWAFKDSTAEASQPAIHSDLFPEDLLTEVLQRHFEPFEAILAMRELQLRWDAYVEELGAFVTELQLAGEDTSNFFPHRALTAFSKERSGPVEWA